MKGKGERGERNGDEGFQLYSACEWTECVCLRARWLLQERACGGEHKRHQLLIHALTTFLLQTTRGRSSQDQFNVQLD